MNWPWHVSWWFTLLGVAATALMLLAHEGQKARSANEMIGARILLIAWGVFWLWFLSNYAPAWAS